jgi:thiamine biosynthesis lipoprotein
VDRAVAELRRGGAAGGLVNAGGDLRAFGARAYPLHLRHPDDPRQFVQMGTLRDAALATSASYTSVRERWAGGMLDARSGAPIGAGISVSVRARFAFVADALTKVVAASGPRAAPLLARCRAQAWVFGAQSDALPDSATTAAWELPCAAAA